MTPFLHLPTGRALVAAVRRAMKLIRHPVAGRAGRKNPQLSATLPPYLVCFCLDTTVGSRNNPPHLVAFGRRSACSRARPLGEAHAIPAGLDRSVHQSGLRRSRTLVARAPLRPQRRLGILPFLRQLAASRASADRSALAYEAAPAHRASAASSTPSLAPNFSATAPQNKKTGEAAPRSF